jgi:hypothetical protein
VSFNFGKQGLFLLILLSNRTLDGVVWIKTTTSFQEFPQNLSPGSPSDEQASTNLIKLHRIGGSK